LPATFSLSFFSIHKHRIQIVVKGFSVFFPKFMNFEIWFSILVRKLLRRSSFISKTQLKARILEFINYFNRTMAKPFQWTYKGKPLTA
jgi:hypothetical protein